MVKITKWTSVVLSVLMLMLMMTSIAAAQEELPPCATDDGTPLSCVLFHMTPSSLVGEFWINDIHFESDPPKFNSFFDVEFVPGLSAKFEFRNIEDPTDPNFNVLYVYNDVSKTITTPALGQWQVYEVTPTKKYIRQAVEITCAVKNWVDEAVACSVDIDGTVQTDLIAPGVTDRYALDPGSHKIALTLVSAVTVPPADPSQPAAPPQALDPTAPDLVDQTLLWANKTVSKTVFTYGSSFVSKQTFSFSKNGHLTAAMDQPNALADWYLDGTLVATQVATVDVWINPFKGHKLEVKNVEDASLDPLSAFKFHWKNGTQYPFVGAGLSKTVTFHLLKEGNWAQPYGYDVPTGSLAEGPHTYNFNAGCVSDGSTFASDVVTFNVDPAVAPVLPQLYLQLGGVQATKIGGGDLVPAVNPQQVLKAILTVQSRDKAVASTFATDCSASITLDGVVIPLTPGLLYQIVP